MKFVLAFAALIVAAVAAPVGPTDEANAVILRDLRVNDGVTGYEFAFDTSNGIVRQEQGALKQIGDIPAIVVQGFASWTSPEGIQVKFNYVADENGYQSDLPIA